MAFAVSPALQLKIIDGKLRSESLIADPLVQFAGAYNEKMKSLPDAVLVRVPSQTGEYERTIALTLALVGSGVSGRDQIEGTEEDLQVRSLSLRANMYGNAVNTIKWGADAELNKSIEILSEVQPGLSRWHKEMQGLKMRQAMIQLYSAEQLKAPSNRNFGLNPNVIVATATGANKIVFPGTTVAAFTTNIVAGLASASATGQLLTLSRIQALADLYIQMESLADNSLVLTVPTLIFQDLYSVAGANNLTSLIKFDAKNGDPMALTGFTYGKLTIMNDPRFPVLNNNAGVLTWYYKQPGGADARLAAKTGTDYHVGILCGKGALYEFDVAPVAFKDNVEDYGKNVGVGAFRVCGYTAGVYSNDPTSIGGGLVDGSGNYASGVYNKQSAIVIWPAL